MILLFLNRFFAFFFFAFFSTTKFTKVTKLYIFYCFFLRVSLRPSWFDLFNNIFLRGSYYLKLRHLHQSSIPFALIYSPDRIHLFPPFLTPILPAFYPPFIRHAVWRIYPPFIRLRRTGGLAEWRGFSSFFHHEAREGHEVIYILLLFSSCFSAFFVV